jgi:hypothetical protein
MMFNDDDENEVDVYSHWEFDVINFQHKKEKKRKEKTKKKFEIMSKNFFFRRKSLS